MIAVQDVILLLVIGTITVAITIIYYALGLFFMWCFEHSKFIFRWYDMWVGAYWDRAEKKLYVFPVPMFGIVFDFGGE